MTHLIQICHRCPNVDWTIDGHPPCKLNGKYFAENCADGICPDNRFTAEGVEATGKPPEPSQGVGTEIKRILASMGISSCQACLVKAAYYDSMGLAWCIDHRADIIADLVEAGKQRGWVLGAIVKMASSVGAAEAGAAALVDMAIAAREKQIGETMQKCTYLIPWGGYCGKIASGTPPLCDEHQKTMCVVCKKRVATHGCPETHAFVCGAPLCDSCEHRC